MRTILVNAQIRVEAHDGIPDEGVLRDLAQQLGTLSSLHGGAWRVETPADVTLAVGWSTPDGHHEPDHYELVLTTHAGQPIDARENVG